MFINQDKSKQETERNPIIAAYLRVSTDKQTILNQKSEVLNFCKREDIKVTLWCTETVSGTKRENERELGTLLQRLQKGDTLIITEVSRLSRKMINIMNIIHQSIEKGITIHSIKEGYKFDTSINSQVLAFAFGLCAEIERTLISPTHPGSPGTAKGQRHEIRTPQRKHHSKQTETAPRRDPANAP